MPKSRKRTETPGGSVGISDPPEMELDARPASSGAVPPEPERIAARAYELYLARGAADGSDVEDWLAAERELASNPARDDVSDE